MRNIFLPVIFFLIIQCSTSSKSIYSQQLSYKINPFNILTVDMRFINKEINSFKDIYIGCETFAKSGTTLGYHHQTVYEIVKGKSEILVKNINLGFVNPQVSNVDCRIWNVKWLE